MDLALAIWQINPQAEYRLDHAHGQAIVEWIGPGEQPTPDELAAAWAAYQAAQAAKEQAAQQAAAQRRADLAMVQAKAADDPALAALARLLGAT